MARRSCYGRPSAYCVSVSNPVIQNGADPGVMACFAHGVERGKTAPTGWRLGGAQQAGEGGTMHLTRRFVALGGFAVLTWPAISIAAEVRGITATEIRIGQTMPYSGPVSAF